MLENVSKAPTLGHRAGNAKGGLSRRRIFQDFHPKWLPAGTFIAFLAGEPIEKKTKARPGCAPALDHGGPGLQKGVANLARPRCRSVSQTMVVDGFPVSFLVRIV